MKRVVTTDGSTSDQTRPHRTCRTCGGRRRFSHEEYSGGGQRAALWQCTGCGLIEPGPPRGAGRGERGGGRAKAPIDDGRVDNPVIDEALARLLSERLDDDA